MLMTTNKKRNRQYYYSKNKNKYYPFYKKIDQSVLSAKMEVYGSLLTKANDNGIPCFKTRYTDVIAFNTEYTDRSLYDLIMEAGSNSKIVENYSYLSISSVVIEVFPNKYNGILPTQNPVLFGIYKGNIPQTITYDGIYCSNTIFPVILQYQRRFFTLNSPYYNIDQWMQNVPQYFLVIRSCLALNADFSSFTFKMTVYVKLKGVLS